MAVVEKANSSLVDRKNSEYLAQLLNDKKQLHALPNVFVHVEKILDEGRACFKVFLTMFTCGSNASSSSFLACNSRLRGAVPVRRPHPPQTPILGHIHCFRQCHLSNVI